MTEMMSLSRELMIEVFFQDLFDREKSYCSFCLNSSQTVFGMEGVRVVFIFLREVKVVFWGCFLFLGFLVWRADPCPFRKRCGRNLEWEVWSKVHKTGQGWPAKKSERGVKGGVGGVRLCEIEGGDTSQAKSIHPG